MAEQTALSTNDQQGLEQAFGVFNELSSRLTDAYSQLEQQVAALSTTTRGSMRGAGAAERGAPVRVFPGVSRG